MKSFPNLPHTPANTQSYDAVMVVVRSSVESVPYLPSIEPGTCGARIHYAICSPIDACCNNTIHSTATQAKDKTSHSITVYTRLTCHCMECHTTTHFDVYSLRCDSTERSLALHFEARFFFKIGPCLYQFHLHG